MTYLSPWTDMVFDITFEREPLNAKQSQPIEANMLRGTAALAEPLGPRGIPMPVSTVRRTANIEKVNKRVNKHVPPQKRVDNVDKILRNNAQDDYTSMCCITTSNSPNLATRVAHAIFVIPFVRRNFNSILSRVQCLPSTRADWLPITSTRGILAAQKLAPPRLNQCKPEQGSESLQYIKRYD
ncbi:hypothetical protein P171DRAFT_265505 [Karstenula rhodostoma CBS 690.94]|uniref:Uncharacterized protein n=1 Tax=Karstenula rhodostoma CBS 690.94 TaxID=1392251 RepID=A0A9P4UCR4_9PLEO|nr:hypothetical protein P171DRAFT_265505 [Karstenula rhodostoma CBS 690.94]